MSRLYVFCEGKTEQNFCKKVLQTHLFTSGRGEVIPLAVGETNHHHVFGLGRGMNYAKIKKFIHNTIKKYQNSRNVYFTTMFDFYALPNDFPGRELSAGPTDPTFYGKALEQAFQKDIGSHRFYAYLQIHEFETMLFAEPKAFAMSFEQCEDRIQELNKIAASFPSIEHINDGRESAPSKRIIAVFPDYDGLKSTAGPEIANNIGLSRIRETCPHVNQWIERLEGISWE